MNVNTGRTVQTDRPSRETHMAIEMNRMAAAIDQAHKAMMVLADKIKPVLSLETPSAEPDCPKQINQLAPLAYWMNDKTVQIEEFTAFIEKTTSRVEL